MKRMSKVVTNTTLAVILSICPAGLCAQDPVAAAKQLQPPVNLPAVTSPPPLEDLKKRKQQTMQRLNQQVEELAQVWQAKRARDAIARLQAEEKAKLRAMETAERERDARQELERLQMAAAAAAEQAKKAAAIKVQEKPVEPVVEPPQEDLPAPGSADVTETNTAETPAADEPTSALTTVDGPIDRMALATSLFATGSFGECLQILDAVDVEPLTKESKDWREYLAASCYRKLGKLQEAESRYRALLGHTEVSWLANATRWWLDHLNEQQKLREDLKQLDTTFHAWKVEIDALRTTN
jgi:tetratricopeptide (TPR) repeat protein